MKSVLACGLVTAGAALPCEGECQSFQGLEEIVNRDQSIECLILVRTMFGLEWDAAETCTARGYLDLD